MYNIPNAELSPRIVNGVVHWYEGDTFELQLQLDITDQDGEPIPITDSDTVSIVFRDRSNHDVKEFRFDHIENSIVTMVFNDEVTSLFRKGNYSYDVFFRGQERTTFANDNRVVVE